MPVLNFPSSPVNGQTYVDGTTTWTYDTTYGVWDITSEGITGPTGYTGSFGTTGYTGSFGTTGYTGSSIGASTNTQIIFNDSGAANGASGFTFIKTTNAASFPGILATNLGAVGTPAYTFTGDLNTGMWSPAADTMAVSTAGAERLRITSAGNVGIGETSPAAPLHVASINTNAYGAFVASAIGIAKVGNGARVALVDFGVGGGLFSNWYYNSSLDKAAAAGYSPRIDLWVSDGSIRFSGSSSVAADANIAWSERMRIDSAGNVGIGTTAPGALLDARGDFAVGAATNSMGIIRRSSVQGSNGVKIQGNIVTTIDDTNPGASVVVGGGSLSDGFEGNIVLTAYGTTGSADRNTIRFQTRSGTNTVAERMRITSAGDVGIGVTPVTGNWSPLFQVKRSIFNGGNSDRTEVGYNYYRTSGVNTYIATDFATLYDQISGQHRWFTAPSGTGGNSISFTQAMVLDASGNVGIGTSAPVGRLTIQGAISTSGINQGLGLLHWTGTQYGALGLNNSTGWPQLMARAGAGLTFHVNSDLLTTGEVMRITSAGNVGIGTSSPGNKLHVVASTQVDADGLIRAENTATTGTINSSVMVKTYYGTSQFMQWENNGVRIGCRSTANGGAGHLVFTAGTDDEKMRITSAGNVGIGTTTPGFKLEVNGSFAATTKSFVIDHPTKPDMKLRYGSLEGPENGVYVRGKLNGNNIIELPDYWTGLVDEDTITVNLTPIGKMQDLFVEDISNNQITVGGTDVNCFYTVFAERKDVEKLTVEF